MTSFYLSNDSVINGRLNCKVKKLVAGLVY